MAFFAVVLGEQLDPALARRTLPALLVLGPATVLYWWASELRGAGDLRPYALVQFLPLLLFPFLLALRRSPFTRVGLLWLMLGAYLVAKLLELLDAQLHAALGFGGHALKHLAAAAGVLLFAVAVLARRLRVVAVPATVPP
jgi:hypothetical protein